MIRKNAINSGQLSGLNTQVTASEFTELMNVGSINFTPVELNKALKKNNVILPALAQYTGIPITLPSLPRNISVVVRSSSAILSWIEPSDHGGTEITGYYITANPGGISMIATTSPATLTGLTNGLTYTFSVVAINSRGKSVLTDDAWSPPLAPEANLIILNAVTNVVAVPLNASASVSWNSPVSNGGLALTSYTVTVSPGGASVVCAVTHATINGLTNGVSYTFSVVATNPIGDSASAVSAPVTPDSSLIVPAMPRGVTAIAGNTSATVSWTAPVPNGSVPITGYIVTSTPGGITTTVGPGSLTATVSGLTNGTAYTFTVVATDSVGNSLGSSSVSPITPFSPVTVPGAPIGVSATAGNASALVSWSAPFDGGASITGYTITSNPGGITTTTTSLSATISGLTNGTAYTFTVVATNSVGNSSSSSSSATPSSPAAGTIWTQTSLGANSWGRVASSSDGSTLVGIVSGGQIYVSHDRGVSWTSNNNNQSWTDIAISSDGSIILAVYYASNYTYAMSLSTNGGLSWGNTNFTSSSSNGTTCIACSSDGSLFIAVQAHFYHSNNYGIAFNPVGDTNSTYMFNSVASSADGTHLVATDSRFNTGKIYTSTDSGVSWTARLTNHGWTGVASSSDGTMLVAVDAGTIGGYIYTSTDSGVTWTPRDSARDWYCVSSSADGTILVAATLRERVQGTYVFGGHIYVSTDSGLTWTQTGPVGTWISVAISADGSTIIASQSTGVYISTVSTSIPSVTVSVPDAPYNVTATIINNATYTVAIQWNVPASNGGPIINYTVTSSGYTATSVIPYIEMNVAAGSYTFTVVAKNSAGNSSPSAPSTPVTLNVYRPPRR